MKTISTIFLLIIGSLLGYAQSQEFKAEDFNLTGDAILAGENCFQLTPAELWKGGAVWYKNQVDLNQPFEMELELNLGCSNGGADGIVFIFYPKNQTGFEGEGIGFGGLRPSLGIELDTYQNHHLSDPEYDHIALMRNGIPDHLRAISDPIPLIRDRSDVEDCATHKAKVQWNPATKILNFFFDGDPRISQRIDLVADIFDDEPMVFWGFTSATGGEFNRHLVCIEKTNFSEIESFDRLTEEELLSSKRKTLEEVKFEKGKSSITEEEIAELNKYVKILEANPKYKFYIEAHTDDSGDPATNKRLSTKRADAVKNYLIKKGIKPERIKTFGFGADFPIAPNDTPEGRAKNRRIEVSLQWLRA